MCLGLGYGRATPRLVPLTSGNASAVVAASATDLTVVNLRTPGLCANPRSSSRLVSDQLGGMDSGNHFSGFHWFQQQAVSVSNDRDSRSVSDSFSHCKVFKESEEVGRTVDLALFNSYDELCCRLASMFGMDKMELQRNLVYRDTEGSMLRVGVEPYRSFMKSVRRLKILSDTGSSGSSSSGTP